MIILGINHFFHDTSACLVKDGELLVALEEERFSRDKHTWSFPSRAIAKCFEVTGISPEQVDHVAVSINPTKDAGKKILYGAKLGTKCLPFVKHELFRARAKQKQLHQWFNKTWPARKPKLHMIDHHLAHVVGSFYVSPYEHAALLSLDGSGEWSTSYLGEMKGDELTCFSESLFPNSLGSFYEAATQFCGFRPNYDEGKTMGLAPFGDPSVFEEQMSKLVSVDDQGKVNIDLSYFEFQNAGHNRLGQRYIDTFGKPRTGGPIEKHHEDVAAATQRVLENCALKMCRILEQKSSADYLVIAGGVGLNSVMNGRILRETRFKDIYVMPAAGDNGTSIGAAYFAYNHILGEKHRFHHSNPFVGNEYDNDALEAVLKKCKLNYTRSTDVCRDTADILHEGKIVGWFQGRMEIGPRALGNRSILADPTRQDMKDKINAEVKHREAYRPFAPSAIAEERRRYFDIDVEAPFMLKVCAVRDEYKSKLPAITHVDGSARLQTVRADTNPRYHRLIEEFGKLSGIPVVLNTSFNIMGEPVVESPLQAIRCFFSNGLDVLVMGDFIVRK
ncbi:carbamoyltransferase C-terminal domain-containing protein [Marinimicrobium sp. ABcell2]|uniref:carbamoyltransferase family protein n=1 Tax=Marinimicrobium sp. ABcell2 TaxID=3069751 RepID=UPI0027B85289|nr:carbamoyltransferase C-terminal domain-containing protein [Marinimicrobium sp. ABcell2]MDQ2075179.1 carbamoyltransferase C-terminal domain-containing protein [Marinimicrobium sp. ABcell2]